MAKAWFSSGTVMSSPVLTPEGAAPGIGPPASPNTPISVFRSTLSSATESAVGDWVNSCTPRPPGPDAWLSDGPWASRRRP